MDWNEFLHEAIVADEIDLTQQALAQGADPNQSNMDQDCAFLGTTELYWAVSGSNL